MKQPGSSLYTLDRSGKYKIHNTVLLGQNWSKLVATRSVCLASHSSLDRLYWLVDTVQAWSGPISIALYITQAHQDAAMAYIKTMKSCYPEIKQQVFI